MVRRLQKSALVAALLSLCLLLVTAVFCFMAVPVKAEGETEKAEGAEASYPAAVERAADMRFTARSGVVYDGSEYRFNRDLNALLTTDSDKITGDMTVTPVGYEDVNGVKGDTLPTVVKNAGTYSLKITVDDETTVDLNITIDRATNDWVHVPTVITWAYGAFDTQVNRIRAVPKYLDDEKTVLYSLLDIDDNPIDELTDFTVRRDGTIVDSAIVEALNGLKVGGYKLKVVVEGTNNYKEKTETIGFNIDKARNAWATGNDDLKLPSWVVGEYNKKEHAIVINAVYGDVNIIVTDINGKVYYNSKTGLNKLNDCEVGKYSVKAWVDGGEDYDPLIERTFTIEVLDKQGLPWWATLCIAVGAVLLVVLVFLILWKKGVFQFITDKIVLSIRTKANVDATIASVRAAKLAEDSKKSVAEAKRKERITQMREKAKAQRALPPEERAARLEVRAQLEAAKAQRNLARSEALKAKARTMRGDDAPSEPAIETENQTDE